MGGTPTSVGTVARIRASPGWLRAAFAAVAAGALAAIALAWLPAPWVWIGGAWFAIGFAGAWLSPGSGALWFNLGIAFLVLGLLEANAWTRTSTRTERNIEDDAYAGPDDVLGYAPRARGPVSTRKYWGDDLLYDVTYTIGEDGLRASPPARGSGCVLFFGGSYTYGEGVDDDETFPWRVGVRSGAAVYNFGFHGYGAHQMLAAVESGEVQRRVGCTPTHAVYQAINDHVNRAAGMAYWDRRGPRYEIDAGGLAVRRGTFADRRSAFADLLWDQGQKSLVVERITRRRREIGDEDIALFHAVVDTTRLRLAEQFPGIAFDVIVWDDSGTPPQSFVTGLEERGIRVHRTSRILPGRVDGDPRFEISPYDPHPNAALYDRLAAYVVEHILKDPPT